MERWRRLIGHDGRFIADLRLTTPAEGGRGRAVQSGYLAQWWLVGAAGETWVGSGPIDLLDGQRSIKPGHSGRVAVYPMDPSAWQAVGSGSVLHLRERVGQTLGVATVKERIDVPAEALLRFDAVPARPNRQQLARVDGLFDRVLDAVHRRRG